MPGIRARVAKGEGKETRSCQYQHLPSHPTLVDSPVNHTAFCGSSWEVLQDGKVSGYSIDSVSQGNDTSNLTITVHRGARNYQVHLQLKLEGSAWKISSADGI